MEYYLGLACFVKIGPRTFERGLHRFGSVKNFYTAPEKDLKPILGDKTTKEFLKFRSSFSAKKKEKELQQNHIEFITREDPRMPRHVLTIPDAPLFLFVKGTITDTSFLFDRSIAVVGTRKASSYGRQVTELFVERLAGANLTIISGMAFGIDTYAHKSCLNAGGTTIAVLGCGVDIMYPAANRLLYQEILSKGGLIVSEYPPGFMPRSYTFVLRNRLISGLSRGVLVVEGSLNSGSMITARYAAEQGRDVFTIPMPITSSLSAGPNSLLKQGARLVLDPGDILEEYNIESASLLEKQTVSSAEDKKIIDILLKQSCSIQDLVHESGLSISLLMSCLSHLEIKGVLKKNNEGKYEVSPFLQSALSV